jgi:hypothetical protein
VAGMASLHSRECQLLETVPFDWLQRDFQQRY